MLESKKAFQLITDVYQNKDGTVKMIHTAIDYINSKEPMAFGKAGIVTAEEVNYCRSNPLRMMADSHLSELLDGLDKVYDKGRL